MLGFSFFNSELRIYSYYYDSTCKHIRCIQVCHKCIIYCNKCEDDSITMYPYSQYM